MFYILSSKQPQPNRLWVYDSATNLEAKCKLGTIHRHVYVCSINKHAVILAVVLCH